ncbi:MAG: RsmD family RNA methyltransferase [Pseudomonadota bacterium]
MDRPMRQKPVGARLPERTGVVLRAQPDRDYALLDSGRGEKLERYGTTIIRRPEGQAIWLPSLGADAWEKAHAVFIGDTDEEGAGRWRFPHGAMDETFPLSFDGMGYWGRFTSFRHTGVFPEQATHWRAMAQAIKGANLGRPPRMLNLFGYTGLASLVAGRAGAEVTHVDASKKAIGWARENQTRAGLDDAPIRWICDDALKFVQREGRRGNTYDIILLDPPAYGRGPKGEVWQLFDDLPTLLDAVAALQSDRHLMTVLTAYAIRASHFALHELMQEVLSGRSGRLESGELVLEQENGGVSLSTSMFSRHLGPSVLGDELEPCLEDEA